MKIIILFYNSITKIITQHLQDGYNINKINLN
jgi:hypothetical protein